MKNFWTLYFFNLRSMMKTKSLWVMVVFMLVGAGGFASYMHVISSEEKSAESIYIENYTSISNSQINEKLTAYLKGEKLYELHEANADDEQDHKIILKKSTVCIK